MSHEYYILFYCTVFTNPIVDLRSHHTEASEAIEAKRTEAANVGFLNVGRLQSGLFQPTFSKKPLLITTRSLLASNKAHDFAEISSKKT